MGKKTQFFVLGVMMLAVIAPLFASAAIVPCGTKANPTACTLCDLFKLGQTATNTLTIVVAPLIAVLAFTLGGFKILMSGANPGYRQEGMKAIRNGVIGLLIVFTAWIVVNEFLLFFVGSQNVTSLAPWTSITCYPKVTPPSTTGVAAVSLTTPYTTSENTILAALTSNPNISVHGSAGSGPNGTCATQAESDGGKCTSVAYLPQNAINGLNSLQSGCGCALTVTGGTEKGHKTHGPGNSIVDLRVDDQVNPQSTLLGIYINNNKIGNPSYLPGGVLYTLPNATFLFEVDAKTGVKHWHVKFN